MLLKILDAKDPNLRKRSKPVKKIDKKIKTIIHDLKDTLIVQDDPEGIGLAAPQIGKRFRIFVMKPEEEVKVIINPEIIKISKSGKSSEKKKNKVMEGCLSLPHYYGPIRRANQLKLKYKDENGKVKTESFSGINAQIVQHEIDHLDGVLFIDRLLEQKKPLYEYKDGEWERVEL